MLLNDYLFIFLDNTEYIKNKDTETYCLNLLQYWEKEIGIYAKTKIFTYMESAMHFVEHWSTHEHVVIIDIGNDLEVSGQFIQKLTESISSDDVLVGHILDKKDRYYELHNQCFYFNANVWRQIGCPEYGHKIDKLTCNIPLRSAENHHDDYTPFWIAPGEKVKTYKNLKQGYNFIKSFLDAGYTIRSFNDKVRRSKMYAYPYEDNDSMQDLLDFNFKQKYYMFNTERIKFENLPDAPLDNFATVSAGLNHLKVIKHCGYSDTINLLFFDWDKYSLHMMEKIYKDWDGTNYPEFISQNTDFDVVADDFDTWDNFVQFWGSEQQFAEWFNEFRTYSTVKFLNIDLMKDDVSCFADFCQGSCDLLWLSNIFHYKPSSILYSKDYRSARQDLVVSQLKKDTLVFADSVNLNQPKFFTKSCYIKQKDS